MVSVLLDAGAGDRWRYTEEGTGQVLGRSEGLGVRWVGCVCVGGGMSWLVSASRRVASLWPFWLAAADDPPNHPPALQVASFHMFMAGAFSSDATAKLRADSKGLQALTTEAIRAGFQVVRSRQDVCGVGLGWAA